MSGGNRPGGLTALAVLNFVAAGFDALNALSSLGLMLFRDELMKQKGMADALAQMPPDNVIWTSAIGDVILVPLLIVSGIGYLRLRRVTGRKVGSMYALASLCLTVAVFLQLQGGMQFGALINAVYPIVTLILLNTTFRDDLVT